MSSNRVVLEALGASTASPDCSTCSTGDSGSTTAAALAARRERQCGWCANVFTIVRKPGRPLIYCSHSCRQRAYERRRGLGVIPPPDRNIMRPNQLLAHLRPQPEGYERGRLVLVTGKPHALRPAGIVDERGRRLTLCGLLAHSVTGRFVDWADNSCKTCARVASVRPPARPVRVSEELAALRSLIDAAAIEFNRPPRSTRRQRGPGEILTELLISAA